MSNVCLIRSPLILRDDSVASTQGTPPLGLAYLLSALKEEGHSVSAIDALGESLHSFTKLKDTRVIVNGLEAHEIIERIPRDVDYIGFSCMFSNEWIYLRYIIKQVRLAFPNAEIIAGGEHITADTNYILETCPEIDALLLGEGEELICNYIKSRNQNLPLENIKGIVYLDQNKNIVKTPSSVRIKNIDSIAWPSWDELPLEKYLDAGFGYSSFNKRTIPMLATRGCPYQCTFCTNPFMWENKWYSRSPQDVVDEIKYYIDKYKITGIDFYDLTFIINKQWVLEFCDILKKENISLKWTFPSGSRSEVIDKEVITALKETGITRLPYAPETGSEKTAKRIKKRISHTKMLSSIKESIAQGIHTEATLIFGFPGQTFKEACINIKFLVKLAFMGINDVSCYPFVPYPGSELHKNLEKEGKIVKEPGEYEKWLNGIVYNNITGIKSWSEHIPTWTMPFFTLGGMFFFNIIQYTIRPQRIFKSIKSVIKGQPEGICESIIYGLYLNYFKGRKVNINSSNLHDINTFKGSSENSINHEKTVISK